MNGKWYELVGENGNALTSVDYIALPDDAMAVNLRNSVFAVVSRSLPANVIAPDLTVFANRAAFAAKQKLEEDSQIDLFGGTKKEALIVQMQQRRAAITLDIPQVNWTIAPKPCPQLLVRDDDQLIELSPSCVSGTGIGRPHQALILYRRPPLVKQWNEINRCSIQTYALLWVAGPPGTGKSGAAFAFAYSLDRSRWDVIWIHYSRIQERFNCVWLQGNEKAVCIVKEEAIKRDLAAILNTTSPTRKTIVFLDGYIDKSAAARAARHECLFGKQYRPELYASIPTKVDEESRGCEMEDVEISAGELHNLEVREQELFELTSWCFDDYEKAVLNDDFFLNVVAMFPTQSDPEKGATERKKLLQEKYFIVGGSARLMFEASTEQASDALDVAIKATPNIELYLKGFGDTSSGAINRLLAWYDGPSGYEVRLVSEYVVRHFAMVMGPHLIENFARACNVNPSMDGFILEAWFFAHLSHNGLAWSRRVGGDTVERRRWEKSSIVIFNAAKYPIAVSLDGPVWMAPKKWNQGGYDAVFIDKAAQLVRFVHVTRAESHKFDPKYFVELLNAGDLGKVATVELCFVVPLARWDSFAFPVGNEDFKKQVVEVASSPSRSTRRCPDQTFKDCSAKVMVIGVDYKITDHYRVEGSQVG